MAEPTDQLPVAVGAAKKLGPSVILSCLSLQLDVEDAAAAITGCLPAKDRP
jgi:hypothetical protein